MQLTSIFPARCGTASPGDCAAPACRLFILLALSCLASMSPAALAQAQLGSDIVGDASQLASAYSVSLSSGGDYLAVGAHNDDGNGYRSGLTRIFRWSGDAWIQVGSDIAGAAAEDQSGASVSLSSDGERVAIGAAGNDDNGDNSGHARVYRWSGAEWAQLGSDIAGEAIGDQSGYSVSLSSDGSRVAIGAPENDAAGPNSGHVRVYQWTGSAWTQLGADIDGEAAWDKFGSAVSLDSHGNRLAIGAPTADGEELAAGEVRVYQWSGSAWEPLGSDLEGEKENNFFGLAVSLSADGRRLAVGAPYNDGNGRWSGHARVFEWSGSAWLQKGADIDGEAAEDRSGSSVALSSDGSRLAIGAPRNSSSFPASGQVRVYEWSGSNWKQLGADIDGVATGDQFGYRAALSADGNRVASGTGNADETGLDPGYVQAFDLSMFDAFRINPGLNDAWYYPATDGQGFYIAVFPDAGLVSLAWFTYDTQLPPDTATAHLGDPGHRWLTALGPIDGNRSVMDITMTSGGLFDDPAEVERTDPPGSDGTITLTFESCAAGTVEYDIPSIDRHGIIPIERLANDNIVICEALGSP